MLNDIDQQANSSGIPDFGRNPLNDVINPYSYSNTKARDTFNVTDLQNEKHAGTVNHTSETAAEFENTSLPNYCFTCRTRAKMGKNSNNTTNNGINPSQHGACDNKGCSGYMGHAPSPRLSRTYMNNGDLLDDAINSDGDTSDDVPLLITNMKNTGSHKEDRHEGDNMSSIIRSLSEEELMAVDHCHPSSSSHNLTKQKATKKAKRQLMIACVLCSLFIAGEVIGGKISNSLAIMSDAAHMTSDFATFCISLFSIWMGEKAAKKSFNFGFHRAEAVGALFTIMIIWFVTGILFYLACSRLHTGSFTVEPDSMMVVAGCAVVFNIVLGVLLHGAPHGHTHGGGSGHGHNHAIGDMNHNHSHVGEEPNSNKRQAFKKAKERHLNVRAALIHVLGDLIQSVGVLIASIIIKIFPTAKYADPICTILFSIIVMCTTTQVLRDVVRILMEGHPKGYSYDEIYSALMGITNVIRVHNLRVWSLTNDHLVLNVHLAVNPEDTSENERILQVNICVKYETKG